MTGPTRDELKALVHYYADKATLYGIAMPVGGPQASETEQEYRERILDWLITVEPNANKRAAVLLSLRLKF